MGSNALISNHSNCSSKVHNVNFDLNFDVFDSLEKLALYVHKLTSSLSLRESDDYLGFGNSQLIQFHNEYSCLYIDKYLETAIPHHQTEILFENKGFPLSKYQAGLGYDGKNRFWDNFCFNDGVSSDLIVPNVKGGSENPYVKFCNAKRSGFNQTSRLLDLVGVRSDIYLDPHSDLSSEDPPVFNDFTLSFPFDISVQLFDEDLRSGVLKKAWECVTLFKDLLKDHFLGVLSDKEIGLSVSLHEWGSSTPFLPHLHFHCIFPHWVYRSITSDERKEIDILFDDLYSKIDDCIDDENRITDESLIEICKKDLSVSLMDLLGFEILRYDKTIEIKKPNGVVSLKDYPIDWNQIKILWTHAVKTIFEGQAPDPEYYVDGLLYDVHCRTIHIDKKNKLLHALTYKSRPPVVDIDRYFRRVDGCLYLDLKKGVRLDLRMFFEFLNSRISLFTKLDKPDKVKLFKSKLDKLTYLYENYSEKQFLDWINYLVFDRKRSTKSFGFLNTLVRYRVESHTLFCPFCKSHEIKKVGKKKYLCHICQKTFDKPFKHKKIPRSMICPVCGGDLVKGVGVSFIPIHHPIIYHKNSKFYLFKPSVPPPKITVTQLEVS